MQSWTKTLIVACCIALVSGCGQARLDRYLVVPFYEMNAESGICNRPSAKYFDGATGKQVMVDGLLFFQGFSEGLAPASSIDAPKVYGYIDTQGRTVIDFQYGQADLFHESRAIVRVPGDQSDWPWARGLIDRKGQWVVPPGVYVDLEYAGASRWRARSTEDKDAWVLLDQTGREVPGSKKLAAFQFRQGLTSTVDDEDCLVYVDRAGTIKLRLPKEATWTKEFREGVAWFRIGGGNEDPPLGDEEHPRPLYGLLSMKGEIVLRPTYTQTGRFSEGLCAVSLTENTPPCSDDPMLLGDMFEEPGKKTNARWGYLDTVGVLRIKPRFEHAGEFNSGLARVRVNGKWGYIDRQGEWVIPPRFSWALDFKGPYARVRNNGCVAFIDKTGTIVVQTDVEDIPF